MVIRAYRNSICAADQLCSSCWCHLSIDCRLPPLQEHQCCFSFPLQSAPPARAIPQPLSPRRGSILKLCHPAQGKKSVTDAVCPDRTWAQQVMNRRKLFGCPGSALTLQFPAIPFGAHHTVDFCTGVTHPVLSVHLFSLFLHPPAVFSHKLRIWELLSQTFK